MERVTGIGGVFVRSADPAALAEWYRSRLGIDGVPTDHGMEPWRQEGGPTVFAPFAAESDYFPAAQQVMLNLRVRDLAAMAAQLRALGEEVTGDLDATPYGRFARVHDPEGRAIELWQPANPEGS